MAKSVEVLTVRQRLAGGFALILLILIEPDHHRAV